MRVRSTSREKRHARLASCITPEYSFELRSPSLMKKHTKAFGDIARSRVAAVFSAVLQTLLCKIDSQKCVLAAAASARLQTVRNVRQLVAQSSFAIGRHNWSRSRVLRSSPRILNSGLKRTRKLSKAVAVKSNASDNDTINTLVKKLGQTSEKVKLASKAMLLRGETIFSEPGYVHEMSRQRQVFDRAQQGALTKTEASSSSSSSKGRNQQAPAFSCATLPRAKRTAWCVATPQNEELILEWFGPPRVATASFCEQGDPSDQPTNRTGLAGHIRHKSREQPRSE